MPHIGTGADSRCTSVWVKQYILIERFAQNLLIVTRYDQKVEKFSLHWLARVKTHFFLIKQLVVNSKKIEGSAAGKQNGLKKTEALLGFFGYSINHNNRTSV